MIVCFDHSFFELRLLFRISGFEFRNFLIQLFLQMPPRRFLDRAALSRNGLFFGQPFFARPHFD